MIPALLVACLLAAIPAGLRWLRVAQREHYLPGAVATFAGRWWTSGPVNIALLTLMVTGLVGSWWSVWWAFLVPVAQLGPVGLSVRGRTSPLAWTARLRRVAIVSGILMLAVYLAGTAIDSGFFIALGLFLLPALIDIALLALGPIERVLGNRWVDQASTRLGSSGAKVVAITGSYGKTTTKQYVAHLLAGTFRTVASPASFNNRMGLARAINEHLTPGTEVFVAEMGTYGPGRDRAAHPVDPARCGGDGRHRPGTSRAFPDPGADRRRQVRDPRPGRSRCHLGRSPASRRPCRRAGRHDERHHRFRGWLGRQGDDPGESDPDRRHRRRESPGGRLPGQSGGGPRGRPRPRR